MEFDAYHALKCSHCGTFFTVREEDCRMRKYDDYLSGSLGFTAYYPCPICLKSVGIHISKEETKHD